MDLPKFWGNTRNSQRSGKIGMLSKIKTLQKESVNKLIKLLTNQGEQKEFTFQAPTGSGKTHMIAEMMDILLAKKHDLIFIVSSLSTSQLAHQNFQKFQQYKKMEFKNLDPIEIIPGKTSEDRISIDTSHNVYILARDLYKNKSKLMDNSTLIEFFDAIGELNKKIIWIKDECHIASKNLDCLREYFHKILNVSATPKVKPDVKICEHEAVEKKLIKDVEYHTEDVKDYGINVFLEIKRKYHELLKINPCLIIQISNKEKGEKQWKLIKQKLDTEYQGIHYVCFSADPTKCETNDNELLKKKDKSKWKEIVKDNNCLVSVIIFKMVIKEGYDIPRACMLYQIRDTESVILDEQVIGRVRRNPILTNWEDYSKEAHDLALKAIVYGVEQKENREFKIAVVREERKFKIKTTRLNNLWDDEKIKFNLDNFLKKHKRNYKIFSIFKLFKKWKNIDDQTKNYCWRCIDNRGNNWFLVSSMIDKIARENNKYKLCYDSSMIVKPNCEFCNRTIYDTTRSQSIEIKDWIWKQNIESKEDYDFHFDSKAEYEFAMLLRECHYQMWGKNFYLGIDKSNDLYFQYVNYGERSSYPDFILKNKKNNEIHIFEVKSDIKNNNKTINTKEYNSKIEALKKAYKFASKKTNQYFYIVLLTTDDHERKYWNITKYYNGCKKEYSIKRADELKKIIENSPLNTL